VVFSTLLELRDVAHHPPYGCRSALANVNWRAPLASPPKLRLLDEPAGGASTRRSRDLGSLILRIFGDDH